MHTGVALRRLRLNLPLVTLNDLEHTNVGVFHVVERRIFVVVVLCELFSNGNVDEIPIKTEGQGMQSSEDRGTGDAV